MKKVRKQRYRACSNQSKKELICVRTKQQNFFRKNYLQQKGKKTQIIIKKHVYLGPPVLEISKIVINEFWFDYVKRKYGEEGKLCCMNTDSLIINIKTQEIYEDIAKDVETRFDT